MGITQDEKEYISGKILLIFGIMMSFSLPKFLLKSILFSDGLKRFLEALCPGSCAFGFQPW